MSETASTAASPSGPAGPEGAFDNDQYDGFLAAVRARFAATCGALGKRPALLVTAASGLFEVFLAGLPPALRASQQCATCRAFFARYGALVRVDDRGDAVSALWDPAGVPAPYVAAVRALAAAVTAAPIAGVLVSSDAVWGVPSKGAAAGGAWSHLAVTPPDALLLAAGGVKTAGQVAAERLEDRGTLGRALADYAADVVKKAAALLGTEALYRSEKCLGVAEWLLALHAERAAARGDRQRDNLTWRAVATAPPGFCHVRSTMIGTLLDDLAAGLPFESVKARFAAKMHPLQYQRPTAAPSAQNLARAEAIVAQLKSAGALERRFARLADVVALWQPVAAPQAKPGGVFSHLAAKPARGVEVDAPPTVMTWDKFSRTVLPDAARIDYLVPAAKQAYMALVTAANPDAPPILQWDAAERRNPVSYYVYVNGSAPADWNLQPGTHHKVTAITLGPPSWYAPAGSRSHHGQHVVFLLDGAKDKQYKTGAGFFPEFLRSEYHEIRATMEAYAKAAVLTGRDAAEACGISMSRGATWNHTFRVTTKADVTLSYTLDRWD